MKLKGFISLPDQTGQGAVWRLWFLSTRLRIACVPTLNRHPLVMYILTTTSIHINDDIHIGLPDLLKPWIFSTLFLPPRIEASSKSDWSFNASQAPKLAYNNHPYPTAGLPTHPLQTTQIFVSPNLLVLLLLRSSPPDSLEGIVILSI